MWILLKIPPKFVPRGPINNIRALVQIMAWRRPGDKSLSEPMLVFVPTHICVTRPQSVSYYWDIWPGTWFNIKMSPYQYRKSHCGDKTVIRASYLHNGISYTGKMTSSYWFDPLQLIQKSNCFAPFSSWNSWHKRMYISYLLIFWWLFFL